MIIVIILLALLAIAYFVGNYFYNFSLNRYTDKSGVLDNNDDVAINDEEYEKDQNWFDQNAIQVETKSVLNIKLVGYEFLNPNGKKWVIVVHGYNQEAKEMSTYIRNFYNLGYNVLAPDLIAHGKSEGDTISMGGFDGKDLKNWSVKLSKDYNDPDIALFGISMGATTVMSSLSADLPKNVKVFIEDSGYTDLDAQFTYQLKKIFNLPRFPLLDIAGVVAKIKGGYSLKDVNVENGLRMNKRPGLILHGEEDGFVKLENSQKAYDLLSSEKRMETFEGCAHVSAAEQCKERYWKVIKEFLDKYFV